MNLWIWNWKGGGYNSCQADSREEALAKAKAMTTNNTLVVDEATLHVGTHQELSRLDCPVSTPVLVTKMYTDTLEITFDDGSEFRKLRAKVPPGSTSTRLEDCVTEGGTVQDWLEEHPGFRILSYRPVKA